MRNRCVLGTVFFAFGGLLEAQGIISTVAGNGNIGYTGDGGPATSATLGSANGIVVDKAGNIYFTDSIFSVVRKINAKGIISTFAGGGSASLGDGGPATSARLGFQGRTPAWPWTAPGMCTSQTTLTAVSAKVDTSGNISTVAGNSTSPGLGAFSGDGGPATSAGLNSPTDGGARQRRESLHRRLWQLAHP